MIGQIEEFRVEYGRTEGAFEYHAMTEAAYSKEGLDDLAVGQVLQGTPTEYRLSHGEGFVLLRSYRVPGHCRLPRVIEILRPGPPGITLATFCSIRASLENGLFSRFPDSESCRLSLRSDTLWDVPTRWNVTPCPSVSPAWSPASLARREPHQ